GVALGGIAAGRAERLLAAAAVEAAVRRHAISVVRADHQALAVAAADERRARLIRRRHAGAVAVAARVGAEISRHAGADRALQRARQADAGAGGVAADAIGAESAFALGRDDAGRAERLAARAAAVVARRIRGHIAAAVVGWP